MFDLSTELIRKIGHRKEIESWRFERFPFVSANQRIVGYTSFIWRMVEQHGNVKNKNKLVEWKAFVDTVGIKCADLKNEFLF